MRSKIEEYKIAVLGVGGSGKSCLTLQFVTHTFVADYDPTIEDSYRRQLIVGGSNIFLEVVDTAGPEEYSSMRDEWMRWGHGFLFVYSLTDPTGVTEVRRYYEQIQRVKDVESFPAVLVGNKSDLEYDRKAKEEEGKEITNKWGLDLEREFYETSAKRRVNVDEAFFALMRPRQMERVRMKNKPKEKCGLL